eukprot:1108336-Prymnesium_polylepis.1
MATCPEEERQRDDSLLILSWNADLELPVGSVQEHFAPGPECPDPRHERTSRTRSGAQGCGATIGDWLATGSPRHGCAVRRRGGAAPANFFLGKAAFRESRATTVIADARNRPRPCQPVSRVCQVATFPSRHSATAAAASLTPHDEKGSPHQRVELSTDGTNMGLRRVRAAPQGRDTLAERGRRSGTREGRDWTRELADEWG